LDNYAKHPSTRILMMAWAVNDALPQVWFPHEGPLPEHLELMIQRSEIQKAAFNSEFERTIIREKLGIDTLFNDWADPMINARYASIAGDLAFVGNVLGLEEDEAKLATGKKLIQFFCKPNRKGEFNDWNSHPDKWAEFVEYCRRDVIAEREIGRKLKAFALPSFEKKILKIDNDINWRGMPVDTDFVAKADAIAEQEKSERMAEFRELTGLENPNSRTQLLSWLKEEGYRYESLGAALITRTLGNQTGAGFVGSPMTEKGIKALKLRQVLAKSSTAKLDAIRNFVSADGLLRNQYVYGGAARTLRWSGRAVQLQNLPRPTIKDIQSAVKAILTGDINEVRKFGPPLEVIASCLRSAFRAPEGYKFSVCDLSSIEVVGVGWVAECQAILNVFKQKRDPYVDFGKYFYGKTYEELDPKMKGISEEEKSERKNKRQNMKPAVLGCGYGLGPGEEEFDPKVGDLVWGGLKGYGLNMNIDLPIETCVKAVGIYRAEYDDVPKAWRSLEAAAVKAVQTGELQYANKVTFGAIKPCRLLYCNLPSGRRLHYIRPQLTEEKRRNYKGEEYTVQKLSYEGNTVGHFWGHNWTWGGKLIENIVQAISRDFLACGMLNATEAGMTIVGHTHDELICLEKVTDETALPRLRDCMIKRPMWGMDVPLDAAGFEDVIYRKD
jgi:DNA polymerase